MYLDKLGLNLNSTVAFFSLLFIVPLLLEFLRQYLLKVSTNINYLFSMFVDQFFIVVYASCTLPFIKPLYVLYTNLAPLNAFDTTQQLFSNTIYSNNFVIIKKELNHSEIMASINSCLGQLHNLQYINITEVRENFYILLKSNDMEAATNLFVHLKNKPLKTERESLLSLFKNSLIDVSSFLYDSSLFICHSIGLGVNRMSEVSYAIVNNAIQQDSKSILVGVVTIMAGVTIYYYFNQNIMSYFNNLVNSVDQTQKAIQTTTESMTILQKVVEALDIRVTAQEKQLTGLLLTLNDTITNVSSSIATQMISDNDVVLKAAVEVTYKACLEVATQTIMDEVNPVKVSVEALINSVTTNRQLLNDITDVVNSLVRAQQRRL
jgi:hypothetical protein